MMKVEVKLYSYHDMDLVGLYKTGKVSFPETTKQVLNSYANKEVYKVKLQRTNERKLAKYPKTSFRKYYHYHVVLNEKEDADAITLLRKITPGYRNNFIKVVLRQYLCGVFLEEYCVDGDASFFNEMSRKFQGGREEREIKELKKERKEFEVQEDGSGKNEGTEGPKEEPESKVKKDRKEKPDVAPRGAAKEQVTHSVRNPKSHMDSGLPSEEAREQEMDLSTAASTADRNKPEVKVEQRATVEGGSSRREDAEFKEKGRKEISDTAPISYNEKMLSTAMPDVVNTKIVSLPESEEEDDDFDDFLDEMTEQY